MAKTLNTTWRTDLMRERVQALLGSELSADVFPDHSPLDEPVAEVAASPHKITRQSLTSSGSGRVGPSTCGLAVDPSPGLRRLMKAPWRATLPDFWGPMDPIGVQKSDSPWERADPFPSRSASDRTGDPTLARLLSAGEDGDPGLGSNDWVVSGAHTQSGAPLLANDPHLDHSVPSVWYMIHLKAPGLNVSGASLPGLPLVVIGHNEKIAWGMTNTGPDVQDLYVETFDARRPTQYLHNGAWVDAQVRDEVIKVRGKRDLRITVRVTRHGPIVSNVGSRDLALKWTALEPHALSTLFGSVSKISWAGNWEEFTAALRDFTGPMQNFVYADRDGNIGYYAAAWVPLRRKGTGAVPAPGSTDDYDWTGYIPFEDLPHSYNPASGMIATANGRVVPDGYPYFITSEWDAPFRTARIFQRLHEGKAFTVADMLRIQTDILTLEDKWLAGQLLNAAAALHDEPQDPDVRYALRLLSHWDDEAGMDSGATLVCEVTRKALLERILKPKLGDDLSGYHWNLSTIFLENVLANGWGRWLPGGDSSFADTLMKSLEQGVRQIPKRVGSRSYDAWKWGNTIRLTFYHPLGRGFPLLGRLLDVGPFPQAGTATTVKATTPRHGPSMRMVVDLSNLDHSVQNITLGESGQVLSPYYKDQFDAWYNGRSFRMPFSDAAVEQATVHKLVLSPEKKSRARPGR
jgi:penicillin amidase